MELLGEGMGLDSADLYKRLKQIRDIDDIIVETAPMIEANKLDLDTVRDALAVRIRREGVSMLLSFGVHCCAVPWNDSEKLDASSRFP